MKIDGIGFENFRVFKDKVSIDLAPITVLTGTNSSGKTTVIKGLKLFQAFWSQPGFGHHLDFEKGNHQLGNFEMTLSKKRENEELTVTYKINHVLFESLTIQLIFRLDNSNPLRNGVLERVRIFNGDIPVHSVQLDDESNILEGYNYEHILGVLLPKLKDLKSEYVKYMKILNENKKYTEYNGLRISFVDEEELCKKCNVDYKRYSQLQLLFMFEFQKDYPGVEHIEKESVSSALEELKEFQFIYELDLLKLFSLIPRSEYPYFIDELWKQLIKAYPNIEHKFNYTTFKEFIEFEEKNGNLHINSWKNSLLLSGKSFDSFLKDQIKLSHNVISKLAKRKELDIVDSENLGGKFYNPVSFQKTTIWGDFYDFALDSKEQSVSERAVINSCEIVTDAMFLEKKLLDKDIKQPIEIILNGLKTLFCNIYKTIEMDFANMYFINSIRANSQRLYLFNSYESEFNTFLVEFLKCNYSDEEKKFLEKWLREFEIAEAIDIQLVEGVGNQIFLIKENEKINLVDLGYGVTQFLPILLKIVYCKNIKKKIIVLEEPETNLHPKFQSKLADLFTDAYKTLGLSFILETHSEYLIRKLQYLTATGTIKTDDTILYYIGNPDEEKREPNEKQIKEIRIKRNGHLSTPFGSGFYDESDNISLALLDYTSLN